MQRDYGYSSSRSLDGLWSPQRIADEAVAHCFPAWGSARSAPPCPVLFHPDTAAGLWGHLVMAISGGTSIAKSSFLLDKLGRSCPSGSPSRVPHLPGGHASTRGSTGKGFAPGDMDIIPQRQADELAAHLLPARKLGLTTTAMLGYP